MAIAVLLAGCGGLASSSGVRPGLDVAATDVPQVRLVFPGPFPGDTPEQIVRGFLRSGGTSDGDYTVARSFLTPASSAQWQPDGPITVFSTEADMVVDASTPGRATVSVPVIASIDGRGRYAAAAAGDQARADLDVEQSSGQWRISALPQGFGRWIASAEVRRLVRPYTLHYVATDRRALVPDVRWFPLDHLTSRLARAQLDPVPPALSGVATTAIPSGSRLAADSVSVTAGVATVELNDRLPADQNLRQGLWAQFVSTLTQDPSVSSVALRADGVAIDLPGVASPVSDATQVGFDAAIPPITGPTLVRRGEVFSVFEPLAALGGVESRAGPTVRPDLPTISPSVVGLALSADGLEFAGVSRDRSSISRWRGSSRIEVPAMPGGGLADPVYDSRGHLWIGGSPTDPAGTALVSVNLAEDSTSAVPRPVVAAWLAGRTIKGLRISPDGARVAVLSEGAQGPIRLDVAGVQRGPGGAPTALGAPTDLGIGRTGFAGLTWVDSLTVATLTRAHPSAEQIPVLFSLDGTSSALPAVVDGVGVVTPGGERQLIVRTAGDQLLIRSGQLWVSAGPGSDVLVAGR